MKRHTRADLIRDFDAKGNSPHAWRSQGMELLAASRALLALWNDAIADDLTEPRDALDYAGPAIMLRGMAVECLLKARALENNVVLARNGNFVPIKEAKRHNLVALAVVAGLSLSKQETGILRGLSRHIMGGRYPIQTSWTKERLLLPDGRVQILWPWNPFWDGQFYALVERINEGWCQSLAERHSHRSVMQTLQNVVRATLAIDARLQKERDALVKRTQAFDAHLQEAQDALVKKTLDSVRASTLA